MRLFRLAILPLALAALVGCGNKDLAENKSGGPTSSTARDGAVAAVRATLDPADRELVDAQEWCAIQDEERLGAMGPPLKLDIKGQTVFVCCMSCERSARADPEGTLAKVVELKAKKLKEKK